MQTIRGCRSSTPNWRGTPGLCGLPLLVFDTLDLGAQSPLPYHSPLMQVFMEEQKSSFAGDCQSLLCSELLGVPLPPPLSPHPPLSQHNWTLFQGRPRVGCSGRPGTQVREGVLKGCSVGGKGSSSLQAGWSGALLSKGFKTPWSYFPWEDVWERIQTSTRKLLSCGGLLYGGWTGRKGL